VAGAEAAQPSLAGGASIGSVAYFGFYREGCVCPIGSIQNVTVALTDPGYSIPILVTVTFFLPLVVAAFSDGRSAAGVALGAIQELVVLKPVQVPRRPDWIARPAAVRLTWGSRSSSRSNRSRRATCHLPVRPFVGFFRMSGSRTC
jgi:hypothetical protein